MSIDGGATGDEVSPEAFAVFCLKLGIAPSAACISQVTPEMVAAGNVCVRVCGVLIV